MLLTLGWFLLLGAAPAGATNLLYYGGPVVHSANVILVQWGAHVRPSYIDPTSGDPGFLNYLASQNGSTSDIGGVLAQYMDTTRHNSQNRFTYGGTVQIDPTVGANPPGSVLDSQIQSNLSRAIGAGTLPRPAGGGLSTIYVVLFPPKDNVCFDGGGCAFSAGGFCAYHGSFQLSGSSTQVLYTAMVDNGPGTPNYGGCGVGVSSDIGNQTSVVSHEVSEAINDPLDSVTSWYDYSYNGEIADKCDGQPGARNGPWTVEPLWSDRDKQCQAGESAFHAPSASFLGPSSGTAGQKLGFDASSSSDPSGDTDSALDQSNSKTFSISSGIVSYRWNWGDGRPETASDSPTADHTFAAAGDYQVSLTVTDSLGFTSTRTQEVSISSGTPGAPVVNTGDASAISEDGATLNGTINPEGQTVTYQFLWGTAPGALNNATPVTPGPAGQSATPVSATLSGLTPSTHYYYQLVASAGASSYPGQVQDFQTASSSPPAQHPVVGTGSAGRVSATGALLSGTINPGGPHSVQYSFAYGTSSASLNRTTPVQTEPGGTTASLVSATLTGLAPHRTYYFRLTASLNGQTYLGAVRTFTTSSPLPGVQTGGASQVQGDSAVLSGWVAPHGTDTIYQVQFGRTQTYGYSTTWIDAGSSTSTQLEQIVLFGLSAGTTYHYRFVAQNSNGTAVGGDRTFTSAGRAAAAPRFVMKAPARVSLSGAGSRTVRVRLRCSKACVAHLVLLIERPGGARSVTLPVAVSHTSARLPRRGAAVARLRLSRRLHRQLSGTEGSALQLVLVGYAKSRGSVPSAPQQATIKLAWADGTAAASPVPAPARHSRS